MHLGVSLGNQTDALYFVYFFTSLTYSSSERAKCNILVTFPYFMQQN